MSKWVSWSTLVEVFFIWLALYLFLRFLRGTHGKAIVTGLTWVLMVTMTLFGLFHGASGLEQTFPTLAFIAENLGLAFGFAVLILLQPELRYALTNLGQGRRAPIGGKSETQRYGEVSVAARHLAERRRGALIVLERAVGLRTWAETGITLDCRVRSEILSAIFEGTSSIHDGAVIIQGDRIEAAGCLLPLSEDAEITSRLGTRHRAAIGLSERSDAVVVIVSEETGHIGIAVEGAFDFGEYGTGFEEEALRERLLALMGGSEAK